MSLLPEAKRRRLEQTTSKLRKPFVSPLKKVKSDQTPASNDRNGDYRQYRPSTLAHTTEYISTMSQSAVSPSTACTLPAASPKDVHGENIRLAAIRSHHRKNSTEVALQRELTKLEIQSRNLHNDLDALRQASALQSSTIDADLEALILKWKLASQNVADELFGTVKERVHRMGGVAAWRESERRKHDHSCFAEEPVQDDDADCEFDSQGEELPEEERQWRKAQKVKAQEEAMDASDPPDPPVEAEEAPVKVWQESNADDDSFTIDMMLRSLNIPVDVIGYDKSAQGWCS